MPHKKTVKTIIFFCLAWTVFFALNSCTCALWTRQDFGKLEQAAQKSDAKAQLLVGEIYEFGVGVPADEGIAARWYQMAANQNEPQGQFYLGMMHDRGAPLEWDAAAALGRLFQSAELGYEKAQIALALLYFKDKGLREEIAGRIERYRENARRGDAPAQYVLGWAFAEGVGLKINPREAVDWYRRSAAQGYTKAQMALGGIYLAGKVAPMDLSEAEKWYEKSAASEFAARLQLNRLRQTDARRHSKDQHGELLRHADASLRNYIHVQRLLIESEKGKNNALVLRACRSIDGLDPAFGDVFAVCEAVYQNNSDKTGSRVEAARQALKAKDWNRFSVIASGLMEPDFDPEQIRGLVGCAWRALDKETRAAAYNIEAQLQKLETAVRSDIYRKNNAMLIPVWTDAFKAALSRARRENPADPSLGALALRGAQVMPNLQQLMKRQKPQQPQKSVVAAKKPPQVLIPGEEDYKKAHEIFAAGRFAEAAGIFEKTTRIRGFRHIAQSYIYMGICNLALINPANVSQARKLRMKGIVCFQNGLRFDRRAALPAGYDKYEPVFTEAKEKMK